nr:galactose oxidase [Bacteroidota bacterium]
MKKNYITLLIALFIFPLPVLFGQGTWTQKEDVGGDERLGAVGFSIESKGYIGLGTNNGNPNLKDFWEYEPASDAWTQRANYPGSHPLHAVGFSINGKGYVGTGQEDAGTPNYSNEFYEFDPSTNAWAQKANFMGSARSSAVAFSANGNGYIGLGSDSVNSKNDFFEYNPGTDAWSSVSAFPGGVRQGAVAFTINGEGYVGTGAPLQGSSQN